MTSTFDWLDSFCESYGTGKLSTELNREIHDIVNRAVKSVNDHRPTQYKWTFEKWLARQKKLKTEKAFTEFYGHDLYAKQRFLSDVHTWLDHGKYHNKICYKLWHELQALDRKVKAYESD